LGPDATATSNARPLAPGLAEEPLEVPRELRLGTADERALREPLDRAIGGRARAPQSLELLLVLDRAQRLHERALGLELESPCPKASRLANREVVALDHPGPVEHPRQVAENEARGLDELDAPHPPRRLRVAEVRVERDALSVDPERPVGADEAGQVADADRVRHEHAPAAEQLAQPVDAHRHCLHRNASASR
jgi:hypothetical protein